MMTMKNGRRLNPTVYQHEVVELERQIPTPLPSVLGDLASLRHHEVGVAGASPAVQCPGQSNASLLKARQEVMMKQTVSLAALEVANNERKLLDSKGMHLSGNVKLWYRSMWFDRPQSRPRLNML